MSSRSSPALALALLVLVSWGSLWSSESSPPTAAEVAKPAAPEPPPQVNSGDSAWMLVSTAFVMLMVPGLALFYGGMVRQKNILATMMQSMVALAIVGVFWITIGYSLAFGPSINGVIGWHPGLVLLQGVGPKDILPGTGIPIYLHVMYQGMFAIITPALISGAMAERIRFGPYCLFIVLWVALVYCPLAHMVWALDWYENGPKNALVIRQPQHELVIEEKGAKKDAVEKAISSAPKSCDKILFDTKNTAEELLNKVKDLGAKAEIKMTAPGTNSIGILGIRGALDFAGGTVVHISAGFAALASLLVLRKRVGYPEHPVQPSSMVLTLLGAGVLWVGWFGFNGGSGLGSSTLVEDNAARGMLAIGAFAATQAAAAAAGLSWLLVEWLHRGKPTALGLASGIVAGLVAVTPASGFVTVGSGLAIGLIAGVVCYGSVALKPKLGYDDSLDAFGVHGVGGFLGAILTGFFYNKSIIPSALGNENQGTQIFEQTIAAVVSAGLAFVVSLVLIKLVDLLCGFTSEVQEEIEGLDHIEHGEVGFNLTGGLEGAPTFGASTPKSAVQPPVGGKRFSLVVEGAETTHLLQTWSDLCQIQKDQPPTKEFKSVYPHFTTIQGNRFRFNGGETEAVRVGLEKLLRDRMKNAAIKVRIES